MECKIAHSGIIDCKQLFIKLLLTVFTFIYIIIFCLLIHDRNYYSKYFFSGQVTICIRWWNIEFSMERRSAPKFHKLNEAARKFTTLGQSCVCHIKMQNAVIYITSRLLFHCSIRLAFLLGRDFYLKEDNFKKKNNRLWKAKAKTYTNTIDRSREIILLKVIFIVVVYFQGHLSNNVNFLNVILFVKTRYSKILVNGFKRTIIKVEWTCILIDICSSFLNNKASKC